MAHSATTPPPQGAPHSRRDSRPLQQAYNFSSPEPSRSPNLRKRARTYDTISRIDDSGYVDGSAQKGGHSLRKRVRVDYSVLEHAEDSAPVPNSATAPRSKKRRLEFLHDSDDSHGAEPKPRPSPFGPDTPSARRRQPSRKSLEPRAYMEGFDDDEGNVQDTIEVGVSFHDGDASELQDSGASTNASPAQPGRADKYPEEPLASHGNNTNNSYERLLADGSPKIAGRSVGIAVVPSPDSSQELQDSSGHVGQQLQEPLTTSLSQKVEPNPPISPAAALPRLMSVASQSSASAASETFHDSPEVVKHEVINEDSESTPQPSAQLFEEERHHQEPPKPRPAITGIGSPLSVPGDDFDTAHVKADREPSRMDDGDGVLNSKGLRNQPPSSPHPGLSDVTCDSRVDVLKPTPNIPNSAQVSGASAEALSLFASSGPADAESYCPVKPSNLSSTGAEGGARKVQWSSLTPYVEGEYVFYPEKRARSDDDGTGDDQTPEDKDTDREVNEGEPMVEDNDDVPDVGLPEAATSALNTPTQGSPVPESADPTAFNSPLPTAEEAEIADVVDSESQVSVERQKFFKYPKIRDADDFISAIENFEGMSTPELYQMLEVMNDCLVAWQNEYSDLGKMVDDYENSLRRRAADAKYEARTRDLHQHGLNYSEPTFVVKGYKARSKDVMSETRYLQAQDRTMAAAYGFEYDPHPSKIGRQNPEAQQVGIMTRGRSLRNQPKQTAKATEAEEVTGKRQRKPVQLFDPAGHDVSRSSTPVPAMGRRRRNAHQLDSEELQSAVNGDANSDVEFPTPRRRNRGSRAKHLASETVQGSTPVSSQEANPPSHPAKLGRKGRGRRPHEELSAPRPSQLGGNTDQRRRHVITLPLPRGPNFSETSSVIMDNGDSRPGSSSSESTSNTAESSYSFRPKRQKRFRDDQLDDAGESPQTSKRQGKFKMADSTGQLSGSGAARSKKNQEERKVQRIKLIRPAPGTRVVPGSSVGVVEERSKDYKLMTKSEKMSASMKNRWANGNMAGAVEKRKATLAAKKAAQAAAEQKTGYLSTRTSSSSKQKKPNTLRSDSQPSPQPQQQQTGQHPTQPSETASGFRHSLPGIGSFPSFPTDR